jgi:hypothetical protein
MMQISVPIEGFYDGQVILETAGFFSGAKLLVNGQPAPKGPKRGQLLLKRDDGGEVVAKLKSMFLDPVPQIVINDNQVIKLAEPLKWYQWVWAGLPVLLVVSGGLIGALVGLVAANFSIRIFRAEMGTAAQYISVAGISLAAGVVYVILAALILGVIG